MSKTLRILAGILFIGALFFVSAAYAETAKISFEKVPSRPDSEMGPTKVSVAIWLIDIDSIDSAAQNFVANFVVRLRWKDPRLAHQGKHPQRYASVDVWTPQIQVANEIGIVRQTLPDVVEVSGEGDVLFRQRFVGPFSQPLNLRDFPFDKQLFRIHLASTGNNAKEIQFVPDEEALQSGLKDASGISKEISLPDWRVLDFRAGPLPYVIYPRGEPIAGYAFEFTAARGRVHYIVKIIMPLLFIVFMSWAVFWTDPREFSTQATLSATSMLALIAYRFSVDAQVPKVPYVTRLDAFMLFSTALVFLALIEMVWISKLVRAERYDFADKMDGYSKVFFPLVFFVVSGIILFR